MKLGEEIIILGGVEGNYFGLLEIDFHLVVIGEHKEVSQLMLQYRLISRQDKARLFMEIWGSNNRWCCDKGCFQVNAFQQTQVINIFLLHGFILGMT